MKISSVLTDYFILLFSDASSVGNYDIQRCYKVNVTFHYQFPGGLTSGTIASQRSKFSSIFSTVSRFLGLVSQCRGVSLSRKDIVTSPPEESNVFFTLPIVFTASSSIADNQVSSKLTECIDELKSYKGTLDTIAPTITQGGQSQRPSKPSTITDKESCCGGDIPPPCCAMGAIKVSSTKCGCLPGFYFVPNRLCVRCPADTYQEKQGKKECDKCPSKKQTFGKTGMTSKSNCSDTNPLQLHIKTYGYLPHNTRAGTVIGNVTVTGKPNSLFQPFLYYIDSITQRQLQSGDKQRQQSRKNPLKRRRRDGHDICEGAGTIEPQNYFCIYRQSGYIEATQHFAFVDGEEFDLAIRVTDSDPWGKTENTARIKLISRDQCKEIQSYYEEAVKFCSNISLAVIGEALSCPSIDCLQPLYSWRQTLNKSSDELRKKCSSDPKNMDALKQKYASCIGKSRVTLQVAQEPFQNSQLGIEWENSHNWEKTEKWKSTFGIFFVDSLDVIIGLFGGGKVLLSS